jgi:hypothetical protein
VAKQVVLAYVIDEDPFHLVSNFQSCAAVLSLLCVVRRKACAGCALPIDNILARMAYQKDAEPIHHDYVQ